MLIIPHCKVLCRSNLHHSAPLRMLFPMSRKCIWLLGSTVVGLSLLLYETQYGSQRAAPTAMKGGYTLAINYTDQMTGSAMNLLSLLCWAKGSELSVVEPFVIGSRFGASLKTGREGLEENAVRLSDVFDIDVWQRHALHEGFSPLVSWEDFLLHAPRDLIIATQPPSGECDSSLESFRNMVLPFASENNFRVVREVCFNFYNFFDTISSVMLTSTGFMETLYGEFPPHKVTVMYKRWGGIHRIPIDAVRMKIFDSKCGRTSLGEDFVSQVSQSISDEVQSYIDKYLNGTNQYTAVMIRFEYLFINHNMELKSRESQIALVDHCLTSITNKLKAIHTPSNAVLLTMDYGSEDKLFNDYDWMDEKIQGFFKDIYGSSLSMLEWERSFEAVASKKSEGYSAILQKELAARAKCLVLAGAAGRSTFQLNAKYRYRKYHTTTGSALCIANACN